ncbi:CDP-glycerol glycerophosphotransferase family protein [Peribacillus asahii]|uniref:CDP-glycerol glycerophosphotransferase family protein n=1 Tax=Peribacillus asahii TaxID=228899 RepID=UPI002079C30F|nr:CDP-glycerol glycerophosphotransferase family protein [Peribacillus asahii]USK59540.1 CDP-glycerol glycerophosphotransferase family protein [Peribacillus asahii]
MARELFIEGYLLFIKVVFSICKLFPVRNKIAFVSSFGDNCQFLLDEINQQGIPIQKVLLKKSGSNLDAKGDGHTIVLPFETKNIFHTLRAFYHLATSKWVVIDNYFGFLAAVTFKQEVTCVQVWHAAGAVKQFGLRDPSVQYRSARAQKRFLEVYRRFHYVTTGSEIMADIYKESFQVEDHQILRTGVPRTDFFFDEQAKERAQQAFYRTFPELKTKQIILYAPTFRDEELHADTIALNLDLLYKELHEKDYVVLLKLHPAVTMEQNIEEQFLGFVYQVNRGFHINELLVVTDLLITDYSSIPFEFSFFQRPMLFFAYDLEQYAERRGFWEDYTESMPGPIVYNTEEILEKIHSHDFMLEKVAPFNEKWNTYSNGQSSKQLISRLLSAEMKKNARA